MDLCWDDAGTGNIHVLGDRYVPVSLFPPQTPQTLAQNRARASAVR